MKLVDNCEKDNILELAQSDTDTLERIAEKVEEIIPVKNDLDVFHSNIENIKNTYLDAKSLYMTFKVINATIPLADLLAKLNMNHIKITKELNSKLYELKDIFNWRKEVLKEQKLNVGWN